ncbi:hypothetical protein GOBAR_DD17396 [Gossypium barbadense]|nr:hypothetical protein GOBAR_DD17396 [Gossypium barbadense]
MCSPAERKGDAEAGPQPLYPMMLEPPELRWAFIRKVYSIVALQLLATAGVVATVVFVHPIARFFVSTGAGFALYMVLIVTPFIRKVILVAAILTATVVVGLTLYTFWAAKRGHDFSFLGPFLFGALLIFFPLGRIAVMMYGGFAAIIFCGYIVYDTDNLIKRHSYDEYIWAAVSLYLDIINLFLSLLTLLRAADG